MGPMDGSNTVRLGTANGVVRARTIKRLPPSDRWNGSFLDEAHGRLHHHWCLNFDRCDERHHAESISNSLGTQTVALGVPTQGAGRTQAVDCSEPCRSSMEATWRPPLKGFCDWSEPVSVLLSLPRNRVVAMRRRRSSLERHQHEECRSRVSEATTRKVVAAAAVRRSLPVIHRHSKSGAYDKKGRDRCTSRITGSAREAPGATNSA